MVVEYLLDRNDRLAWPRSKAHLDVLLRMSQWAVKEDPMEARILYFPGCLPAEEVPVQHVVRRFTWNRARDLRRNIVHPDTHEEFYRLDDPSRIAAAAKIVEKAFGSVHLAIDAAGLPFEPSDELATGRLAQKPIYRRWLSFDGWPDQVELRFHTGSWSNKDLNRQSQLLNSAWDELWNSLGEAIDETRRLRGVTIRRDFPQGQYARALASLTHGHV